MLDRDELLKGNDSDFGHFEDEDEEIDSFDDSEAAAGGGLFLGMTPVERMFISIFLFMNVTVLGIALLLATGRMG
jgi:hypothetical protein